jgi:REP element-mobilizing transposase RayT
MNLHPGQLHHFYNRGNNGEQVFYTPEHYHYFLRKVRTHLLPAGRLLAYCLMPNHFHLLFEPAETDEAGALTQAAFGVVLGSYAQGLNKERGRTGSLFQKRTKAKLLEAHTTPGYALTCLHYIHQNPYRAQLVAQLADWPYSSYRDYAGLREGTLCALDYGRHLLDLPTAGPAFQAESTRHIPSDQARGLLY